MPHPSFAFITPSYAPDYELCCLLKRSLSKFNQVPHTHYIIVETRDIPMFSQLSDETTQIISVESVIPSWIFRFPLIKWCWFSFRSLPIRNWILQQLVKLSVGLVFREEIFVFLDSDIALIRPLEINQLVHNGNTRLFRIPEEGNIPSHYPWHRAAAKLLGLPIQDYFGARYIGHIISWRRDHLLRLYAHIEKKTELPWQLAVSRQWNLSEYILYGVFISEVLKGKSKHFFDDRSLCLEYWSEKKMSPAEIGAFVKKLEPWHTGVMISAKARMPIETHKQIIQKLETRSSTFQ